MWLVLAVLAQTPSAPLPWSEPLAPAFGVETPSSPAPPSRRVSTLQTIGAGAWLAYRATVGSAKGPTCNFSPSCSLYGHEAIERVGLPLGLVLFGARLMRGHVNFDHFYRFNGVHLVDPLDLTLDWLTGERGPLPWRTLLASPSR